jgi:hypothetical protein
MTNKITLIIFAVLTSLILVSYYAYQSTTISVSNITMPEYLQALRFLLGIYTISMIITYFIGLIFCAGILFCIFWAFCYLLIPVISNGQPLSHNYKTK